MTSTRSRPAPARPSESRFERLAHWSIRHRRRAIALWLVTLLAVLGSSFAIGADWNNDFALPGTESQAALDTLKRSSPAQAGDTVQIVMRDPGGVGDPRTRERVESMVAEVSRLPHVAGVQDPFTSGAVSRDGTIAYATVALDDTSNAVPRAAIERLIDTAEAARGDGLQVELGGDAVRYVDAGGGGAESIGTLAALVILVFLFGSLLAASIPIVTALIAVGGTTALIVIGSHLFDVADFTPALMSLVGLGVGIDYALLIFSRYRSELLADRDRDDALRIALDTAGRSVVFAGATVIIGLLGLIALGIGILQGVALGVSVTVLVTMVASLTLLPALLTVFGKRIERSVRKRALKARRRQRVEGERWRRWAAFVQARPVAVLAVAGTLMVALALPATDMRLGFADAGNDSASSGPRKAYDLLADGFGAGFNGPLLIVADGGGAAAAESLRTTLADTPGVAAVAPPQDGGSGEVTTVVAFPDAKPQDEATQQLVTRLRDDVLPPLAARTGATYLVGGSTAAADDYAHAVQERLPLFVAIVVGLSALLLMVVFRSLLIPLKAAVLNLLSIGAALGVVTLVFQHGLFGIEPSPVDSTIPILIFAIVFGLSMDYEVFLVGRMHEEWERTGDARHAVREGLAATGRVITAAGAIMVVVFGAFMTSPDRMMKQFGLGLAVAILLDAVVIRCLIVPAVMRLMDRWAWWMPRWLSVRLPRVALERRVAAAD
ncbi:MMPL family transporter [Conexibacter stalactiti]|uniref:MMPL family transporter n=1 Tax=Conexibacter stalactiti TaxID=1940611 RepID=A0ABU4HYP0_9ACTN|nr:MMPL family transporter [Conexibacter stalactiti]MDW5598446.1 MMPL family transporter [Conexibacter stalactiti]MEC5039088.1 MMPL family transporter [Conexibacter stalactiti]